MIPVSTIVDVSITVGAQYPARAGFGRLMLITKEIGVLGIAERTRSYSDITGVSADWPGDSEVVKAATAYFSQQPKPTEFSVGIRFETAQAAQLRGGAVVDDAENLALFKAIADGSFAIEIDGVDEDITTLDFSSATDLSDVATTIEAALQVVATGGYTAATCTHDGTRFFVESGTTGVTSTIKFLAAVAPASGTDISALLEMTQGTGTFSNGIDAETITTSLNAIEEFDRSWYGLAFTKEVRDLVEVNSEGAVVAAASWCEARVKVFFNTTNDLDVLDSVTTTDIASVLKAANYRRTMTTYSTYPTQYPACSIAGRAFTVNFSQPNSTLTLKFKQLPGITVETLSSSKKAALDSKNGNAFIVVGSTSIYAESFMASGVFFDEVHGIDWLTDAVQTNVFGYLVSRSTKVPYTNKGVEALAQQVRRALDEGVTNGLLAPGETVDEVFLPNGYEIVTILVEDINQSDVDARHYPGLSFTVLGAGAIHSVQINGVFER